MMSKTCDWLNGCWRLRTGAGKGDLLLQMDVEGAEYAILHEVSEETLAKFRIMIIEFHYVDRIFDRNEFAQIKQVFDKLLKQFYIVHVHPNNSGYISARNGIDVPTVMEFTFFRRDRVLQTVCRYHLNHIYLINRIH